MKLLWEERAWNEYCYWQSQDKKTRLSKTFSVIHMKALESPNLLKEIFKAGGADESTTAIVLFIRNTMEQ